MENFGYISAELELNHIWTLWDSWLPERWAYFRGPLPAGRISGALGSQQFQGWGWKMPAISERVWNEKKIWLVWRRFKAELMAKQVKIVGLKSGIPDTVIHDPVFPGISDGKCLELLWFNHGFRDLLRKLGLAPGNAEVGIVWEEGNLGFSCARLVARRVRFLTLIHPDLKCLEQAAAVVMAETGISPKLTPKFPTELRNLKLLIVCGPLSRYNQIILREKIPKCELFQNKQLHGIQQQLSWSVNGSAGALPIYSELGETIIRILAGYHREHWYGSNLMLERVDCLARFFKELGWHLQFDL